MKPAPLPNYASCLDVPFEHVLAYWDQQTRNMTDPKLIRALALWDRYFLMVMIFDRHDMLHPWIYARCREVEADTDGYLDLWSREHYKDLANDTPMLTHNRGWTTHGELRVGDQVYGPDGAPVTVQALTPVYLDSECYRVTFQDGATLIAGAGHQWRVRRKLKRRVAGTTTRDVEVVEDTYSTAALESGLDVGAMTSPVVGAPSQLMIDPYVLGVWLGDGASGDGRICGVDQEIFDTVRARGYELGEDMTPARAPFQTRTVYGIRPHLRDLGVLNDKYIPDAYMNASVHQRMMLLRGLMDTDGHCNTRGTATFCNTNQRLAEQVYDLATGLALRPRIRPYTTQVNGADYEFYQVSFQAHTDRNPFALPRKMARAIKPSEHRNCRSVVRVERISSVPTRCIQVQGGMYLAGRQMVPTRNSTIITYAGIIQEVLRNPELTIGIFSHNRAVASKFLIQIKNELQGNTKLKQLFPDVLYTDPQAQSPMWNQSALVVKRKTNPKESTIEAWGLVDGSPIGAHFQLVVMDDLVTEESVNTPEQIEKTTNAWELSDNLGVAEGGRRWMIGTRYHFSDTYDAIAKKGTVKLRVYPATDDGTEVGNPVLWSPEVWARKKVEQGPRNVACQLLLNPNAGQQGMFEVDDLNEYDVRPSTLNVYITCDPARSKKKDSDRTAMCVIGVDYALNKYLLDGFNHKMNLQERWEHLAALWKKWRYMPGVQHIKAGYEIYGAQADMDYFLEQMRLPDQPKFSIEELAWPNEGPGSKNDRVQRLGPDFRKGKFFLPMATDPQRLTANQQMVKEQGYEYRISKAIKRRDEEKRIYDLCEHFRSQVTYFPHFGKKDLVDAASRLYDMSAIAPTYQEPSYSEPEIV